MEPTYRSDVIAPPIVQVNELPAMVAPSLCPQATYIAAAIDVGYTQASMVKSPEPKVIAGIALANVTPPVVLGASAAVPNFTCAGVRVVEPEAVAVTGDALWSVNVVDPFVPLKLSSIVTFA